MKFYSLFLPVLFVFISSINAQEIPRDIKIYKTWISLTDKTSTKEGVLYEVKDSSIIVSNSLLIQYYHNNTFESVELKFNQIETIRIRKKIS